MSRAAADGEFTVVSTEQLVETMARLLLRCRATLSSAVSQVGLVEDISSVLRLVESRKKDKSSNGVPHYHHDKDDEDDED